jgi:hypothetical protein
MSEHCILRVFLVPAALLYSPRMLICVTDPFLVTQIARLTSPSSGLTAGTSDFSNPIRTLVSENVQATSPNDVCVLASIVVYEVGSRPRLAISRVYTLHPALASLARLRKPV